VSNPAPRILITSPLQPQAVLTWGNTKAAALPRLLPATTDEARRTTRRLHRRSPRSIMAFRTIVIEASQVAC